MSHVWTHRNIIVGTCYGMVELEIDGAWGFERQTVSPDEARAMASAIIEAADIADAQRIEFNAQHPEYGAGGSKSLERQGE